MSRSLYKMKSMKQEGFCKNTSDVDSFLRCRFGRCNSSFPAQLILLHCIFIIIFIFLRTLPPSVRKLAYLSYFLCFHFFG